MKKTILLASLGLLMVSSYLAAQPKPIMGYDKVKWGTSVADVRKVYNISDSVPLTVDEQDSNLHYIIQDGISNSISQRKFYFKDDKLYRVWVIYKDTSDANAKNLFSVIVNSFGNRTDYDISNGSTYYMFQQLKYIQETSTFGKYSPDLVVELLHIIFYNGYEKDVNNLLGQNSLRVCYTWKKFRDEYQASKLGL
jgi:hypothetical protein